MKRHWMIWSLALAMMVITGGVLGTLRGQQKLGKPGLTLELPARVLDFDSAPSEITKVELEALPKDTSFGRRLYWQVEGNRTNQIQLNIVLMGADRTSIHNPRFCLTGQGWRIDQEETQKIPVAKPHAYALPVMKVTATSSQQIQYGDGRVGPVRGLYIYWFVADQSLTASHWQRMWWMARHLLVTGTLQRWAYVSCFALCLPGEEEATYERVRRFIGAAVPGFQLATGPVE